jgi:hypothetical protein
MASIDSILRLDENAVYSSFAQNPLVLFHHIFDITLLLSSVLLIYVTCLGWGALAIKYVFKNERGVSLAITTWSGVLIIASLTELSNFFWPIDWRIGALTILIGSIGAFSNLKGAKECWNRTALIVQTGNGRVWKLLILIAIFTYCSKTLYIPLAGDNMLYHFNTIKWINEYPIIPGLGNLHGRLAFNQIYFEIIALANFYPYWMHGTGTINFFFLTLTILTVLQISKTEVPNAQIFTIGFLWAALRYSDSLPTSNSNYFIGLLQVSISALTLLVLYSRNEKFKLLYFIFLWVCAFSVMAKFSSAVFASLSVLITLPTAYSKLKKERLWLLYALVFSAAIYLIHALRGYILSGYPLYPSTLGGVDSFEWSMPIREVIAEYQWVLSWSRAPGLSPEQVLKNYDWINTWLINFPLYYWVIFGLSAACITALAIKWLTKKSQEYKNILLIIPPIGSVVFWFFTAPSVGFIGVTPEILLTYLIWALLGPSSLMFLNKKRRVITLLLALTMWAYAMKTVGINKISLSGWQEINSQPLEIYETKSGLRILHPIKGDQCGDSELPCSPYLNPNLRLINNDNIRSGFSQR